MSVDPLTLAVVRGGLEQIAEEMDLTMQRTAFSPVISEANDFANGIYEADNGEVVAQGRWGLALFIGVMQFTTQAVLRTVDRDDIHEGDIFFVNDPYSGGTHLMDVGMVKPFFHDGEVFVFLSNRGHWPDIGGMVPGGFASSTTEVYQEGLRIPPVKLFNRGVLNEDLLKLVLANIRVPRERRGDIQAHLAAFEVGERRLRKLLNRYGPDTIRACIAELKDRSETQMRSYLDEIPDGLYEHTDHLDNDGIGHEPLRINLKMTVSGSDAHLDFSGSSPPCQGPMNSVVSAATSACYLGFRHIFPEVPVNAGCFKPLTIDIPESTFLNAQLPAPVAGCSSEVSQRVGDVVMGALELAVPERGGAGIFGTITNQSIGGIDEQVGPYVMYMFNGGGYGGHHEGDGLIYGAPIISVARSQPVELYEQRYPVRIRKFAIREESAGAGEYRGGFGAIIETEFTRGVGTASVIGDRGVFSPRGIHGGGDAANCRIEFIRGDQVYIPRHGIKDSGIRLDPGDLIRLYTPGGGGYGDPLGRDPIRVAADVRNELIGRETARDVYGVVFTGDGLEIDEPATRERRAELRNADNQPA